MSSSLSHSSLFNKLFPPPKFLSMPAVGLSISDRRIRLISFKPRHHGLSVSRFAEHELAPGIVEAGYVNDQKPLVEALRAIKKECKVDFVHAILPEEKAYLFKTEIPHMDTLEARSSIEFKIQENVPISPAKATFDYSWISGSENEQKGTQGVSVVVVPSKVVSVYTDVLKAAGLTPLSFHTESQAIAKSVIKDGDMATSLVIHFRETKTVFFIVSRGVVQFASTLAMGSDALTALIQRYFKVSFEEAEKLKHTQTFANNEENVELFLAMVNEFSVIKDEVNKLFNYWRSYAPQKEVAIEKVVLSGEDALLPGIDRYLSLDVPVRIEIANVWVNAFSLDHYIPPIDARASLNYAPVIGLAISN